MAQKIIEVNPVSFCLGEIDEDALISLVAFLNNVEHGTPIDIYLNSQGGLVHLIPGIIDLLAERDYTIKVLKAFSSAAVLLSYLNKDRIYAFPSTVFMIHGVDVNWGGTAASVEYMKKITDVWSKFSIAKIKDKLGGKDPTQEYYFTADEALDYGLIGGIIVYDKLEQDGEANA
jgi:ATP-dependent protease ClpP protease subunit